ncbi:hypothetical protein P4200_22480, partial [Pseudomonas aeruginosa]|nr:hypothetical protein [Pseudomonas aeruginosa]
MLSGSSCTGWPWPYRLPAPTLRRRARPAEPWWGPDEQQPQWLVRQFAAGERLPLAFFPVPVCFEEPEADGILGSNRSSALALQGSIPGCTTASSRRSSTGGVEPGAAEALQGLVA